MDAFSCRGSASTVQWIDGTDAAGFHMPVWRGRVLKSPWQTPPEKYILPWYPSGPLLFLPIFRRE